MDPLSDVLRAVRFSSAVFYKVEATAPWSAIADSADRLLADLHPGAEHLISYHIVVDGHGWAMPEGGAPLELRAGDVILFPHGDPHAMSSEAGRRPNPDRDGVHAGRYPGTVRLGTGPRVDTTFVCGFFGCDRSPFNPLIASLPRVLHVSGLREGWLPVFAAEVVRESGRGNAGAEAVLARAAELMFMDVLRHHLRTVGPGESGWLAGLADPVVGGALARLHAEPSHAWTLDALAAAVASSRSVLAERFTRIVGQPPMQYLAAWRMQLAAGMLASGAAKVAAVAAGVGYESEAAFSRAFKRATGVAPSVWRAGGKQATMGMERA
jgi:AraC-like DNA-binding protein